MNENQRELIAIGQRFRNAKICLERMKEDVSKLLQTSPDFLQRYVRDLMVDVDDNSSKVDLLRDDLNSMGCIFNIRLEDTVSTIQPKWPYTPINMEQHKAFFRWRAGFLKDNIKTLKHRYSELKYELAPVKEEARHQMMTTSSPQ